MLNIDHMRLQLPAGFEHRGANISRLVSDSMAEFKATENRKLDSLAIGPIQVSSSATDHEIANNVVARITEMLRRGI